MLEVAHKTRLCFQCCPALFKDSSLPRQALDKCFEKMRKSRMIFKLWHRSVFDTKSKNKRKISPKDRIYAWMINTAAPGPCFAYIYIYT